MNRVASFGVVNFAALFAAVLNAYKLNGTFYSATVYFSQSRISMILLGSWGLFCWFILVRMIKDLLLGPLRLIEIEHVNEYSWITLSETFLAMTIFKDEIDANFIFSFTLLMTFRFFHWITRDRIEFMEQTLQLPPKFIMKIAVILSGLLFGVSFLFTRNILNVMRTGPSMSILFANEYALTGISLLGSCVRFGLNCMDVWEPESPFEHRSTTLFYMEFIVDLSKLIVYSAFFAVVMYFYGLPIHIIRDLYMTVISFTRRVRDMINYHQVMASIDTRFPDVSGDELAGLFDRTCIICREEMQTLVKKLPCGHVFHFKCLKSWLERQQVCPTCRKSVLKPPTPTSPVAPSVAGTTPAASSASLNSATNLSNLHERSAAGTPEIERARTPAMPNSPLLFSPNFGQFRSPRAFGFPSTDMNVPALPVMVYNHDNEHHDRNENLRIETELERFGRRSRSTSPEKISNNSKLADVNHLHGSSLTHVQNQIEYVKDLLVEHENLLHRLKEVEKIIRSSHSSSFDELSKSKGASDSDEKSPAFN